MLDQFEIIKTLAEGGSGIVYQARQRLVDRIVAIKVLSPSVIFDETSLKRFQREARIASSLDHPNIAKIYSYGISPDQVPYLVMEFLEGKTLAELIKQNGKLSSESFNNIFSQVCNALDYAQNNGIIHRDIKPGNIMLVHKPDTKEIEVKVLDFGIAKKIDDQSKTAGLTQTGVAVGTPVYMSPEQCRGEECDRRSDIYSLGCVMYEALSGRPPFSGNTAADVMLKHLNEAAPEFAAIAPELKLPPSLLILVYRSLSKRPEDRPQTAAEIAETISEASRVSPVNVRLISRRGQIVPLARFLRPKLIISAVCLILAALAAKPLSDGWQRAEHARKAVEQRQAIQKIWSEIDEHMEQAKAALEQKQYAATKKIYENVLQAVLKLPPEERESPRASEQRFSVYRKLAKCAYGESPKTVLDDMTQAIHFASKAHGPRSEAVARAEYDLAIYLADSRVFLSEAEKTAKDLLELRESNFKSLNDRLDGDSIALRLHQDDLHKAESRLGVAKSLFAYTKLNEGKVKEAVELLEDALRIQRQTDGESDPTTLWTMYRLCFAYDESKQFSNEDAQLNELFQRLDQQAEDPAPVERQYMFLQLIGFYSKKMDHKREKTVIEALIRMSENDYGTNAAQTIQAKNLLKSLQQGEK